MKIAIFILALVGIVCASSSSVPISFFGFIQGTNLPSSGGIVGPIMNRDAFVTMNVDSPTNSPFLVTSVLQANGFYALKIENTGNFIGSYSFTASNLNSGTPAVVGTATKFLYSIQNDDAGTQFQALLYTTDNLASPLRNYQSTGPITDAVHTSSFRFPQRLRPELFFDFTIHSDIAPGGSVVILPTFSEFPDTPVPSPVPATPVPPTPVPATPVPATPVPPTPVPATPVPATPVPPTPVPATPVPATPVPATPVPATPVPATPVPPTPVPATPVPATPVPATPVPPTPVPATPVPPTPVPATPVPATPVPATPVPATPVPATPVPATPVPPTPVPATPVPPTPVPPTPVPATPVPPTNNCGCFPSEPFACPPPPTGYTYVCEPFCTNPPQYQRKLVADEDVITYIVANGDSFLLSEFLGTSFDCLCEKISAGPVILGGDIQ